MKASLFAAAVLIVASFSVFGQQLSAADQEMMKIRQTLSDEYSAAAAKKDLADMVDHYTADVIIATICPESTPIVGREAYTRRSETLLKAGFRDYVGKVTQAHVLSSDEAWSTDTSSFTVKQKKELKVLLGPLEGEGGFGLGRTPGSPSRWSSDKDLSWTPLRPERVVEVKFDYLQGDRFRHGATFLRWRDDKPPRDCSFSQLLPPKPFSLEAVVALAQRSR